MVIWTAYMIVFTGLTSTDWQIIGRKSDIFSRWTSSYSTSRTPLQWIFQQIKHLNQMIQSRNHIIIWSPAGKVFYEPKPIVFSKMAEKLQKLI